jgi:hypothetical protein
MYIASCDSQNILSPPCESLKIFHFPKYIIYDTTIHKAHFFFHWIDFNYLLDDLLALCSCDAYELSVDSKCLIMCYKCSRLKVIR